MSDPFQAFATQHGLCIEHELLYAAPRDVLQPPSESDQYFLVTLSAPTAAPPVRLIYIIPLAEPKAPVVREVLWWLAGDAWALDHASGVLESWAAHHGYRVAEPATKRLFESHRRQAAALAALVGPSSYHRLLALFDAQVSAAEQP